MGFKYNKKKKSHVFIYYFGMGLYMVPLVLWFGTKEYIKRLTNN